MFPSINLLDHIHVVEGLAPVTPSSSTPDYLNLKNAESVLVLIHAKNATTVTGSAITLKQATAVAGTSEKALSFTDYYKKEDTGTADAPWTRATAVSDTFTTDATNSKNSLYAIPATRPRSTSTTASTACAPAPATAPQPRSASIT